MIHPKELDLSIYQQIVANSWDAITLANLEGYVLLTNPAAQELYGYSSQELVGKHVDIFNAQVNQDTQQIIDAIIQQGGWSGEIIQRKKDGTHFNALLTVSLVYGSDGNPMGYVSNSRDISERIATEKIHRLTAEHLKTINSNAPHYIYEVTREGRITYINRADVFPEEEVLQMTIYDFNPPQYHGQISEGLKAVFEEGQSWTLETVITYPDNSTHYFNNRIAPVKTDKGIHSAIILAQDVTESRQAVLDLERNEAQLSAIINTTQSIIASIDSDCRLLYYNQSFIDIVQKGFGMELKPGMSIFETMVPENHDQVKGIYDKVFGGEALTVMDTFLLPTGDQMHMETSYNPIRSKGQVTGIAMISTDISHRVNQEQKLKQALKEKEALLAEIHHRLKNNLAVISGMLQIQSQGSSNAEIKRLLKDSQDRIRTTSLVHEMLYQNDSMVDIQFDQYIHQLGEQIKNGHAKEDQEIRIEVDATTRNLDIQHAIPCGLFINEVLTNAFKHGFADKASGRIGISFSEHDDVMTLQIENDGHPFPQEIDPLQSMSTGMNLLGAFSEQLEGELSFTREPQTMFRLTFTSPS